MLKIELNLIFVFLIKNFSKAGINNKRNRLIFSDNIIILLHLDFIENVLILINFAYLDNKFYDVLYKYHKL